MERENTCMVSLQFDISILAVTVALVLKLVFAGNCNFETYSYL